ncbi:hypothetical protein [Telluria beijingensis]|uniref:hypothetical protein n=1 Tax=Telluria beijingensis TaxID=3068633 RepID=UPI002795715B|nr:hypothetical protein [Massilia sp. REN29]
MIWSSINSTFLAIRNYSHLAGVRELIRSNDGKEQKFFATGNPACIAKDTTLICTDQIIGRNSMRGFGV